MKPLLISVLLILVLLFNCEIDDDKVLLLPQVITDDISEISFASAKSGGTIVSEGGDSVTTRGVCWSINPSPTNNDSKIVDYKSGPYYLEARFVSSIFPLISETKYYVRAYASNSVGTSYGNEVTFVTPVNAQCGGIGGGVTDVDGNTYNTTIICSQEWMSANLNTAKYANGDPIPKVTDQTAWDTITTGAWCWYNNDSATYAATYGKLYNWFAVNDPRGLAPAGWHIPSDVEWTTLSTSLGGHLVAGGAMKETGTTHWTTPNTGATNSSGFTGLPGGICGYGGTFFAVGGYGYWWSSADTDGDDIAALYRYLGYDSGQFGRSGLNKRGGISVRCLRD